MGGRGRQMRQGEVGRRPGGGREEGSPKDNVISFRVWSHPPLPAQVQVGDNYMQAVALDNLIIIKLIHYQLYIINLSG